MKNLFELNNKQQKNLETYIINGFDSEEYPEMEGVSFALICDFIYQTFKLEKCYRNEYCRAKKISEQTTEKYITYLIYQMIKFEVNKLKLTEAA